jgi:hypothetical protein
MHKPKLLSVVTALAFVAFALSFVERPEVRQATGYPQLVSVQDLNSQDSSSWICAGGR